MRIAAIVLGAFCAAAFAGPARASEVFGGVYVHDVDTFLTKSGVEDGLDVQIGWRGDRLFGTPLQPYAYLSAHTGGQTHFAAAGLSAKFGGRLFVRPGVGIAVHTGTTGEFQIEGNDEIEFGSRILFAPELGVGFEINERMSVEASWVHLSHGQLFGGQNPGMDSIGLRLTLDLP